MENQTQIFSNTKIEVKINQYKSYGSSVGNNLKSIQITTKYRYEMLRQDKLKTFCKVSIEEACKRWKIEIIILKVLNEHSHMIVDCPRTISDAKLMQIIKGLSSYILFRLCPDFRKRYPRGEFWNDGYFCASCGSDFEKALKYIENQEFLLFKHYLTSLKVINAPTESLLKVIQLESNKF